MIMFHRFLRRGTAVLMLVLVLALAGARPAAAQPAPWRAAVTWLVGLWQAATGGLGGVTTNSNGDRGAGLDPNGGAAPNGDRGAGLDPNGGNAPSGPTPVAGQGQ
jgi:hypothetical protein